MKLEQVALISKEMQADQDKTWKTRDVCDKMDLVNKILTKSHWSAINADKFKVNLFCIIPSFKNKATWKL